MGCEPFAYDTYHFWATLRVGAVVKQSNHRLLRCSNLRVPGSMLGFASVKVSIKFIHTYPAIWLSHEIMTVKALQKNHDFMQNYIIQGEWNYRKRNGVTPWLSRRHTALLVWGVLSIILSKMGCEPCAYDTYHFWAMACGRGGQAVWPSSFASLKGTGTPDYNPPKSTGL